MHNYIDCIYSIFLFWCAEFSYGVSKHLQFLPQKSNLGKDVLFPREYFQAVFWYAEFSYGVSMCLEFWPQKNIFDRNVLFPREHFQSDLS